MLRRHQNDHGHPQRPQLSGVRTHGGQREGALTEHAMGRRVFMQMDEGSRRGEQTPPWPAISGWQHGLDASEVTRRNGIGRLQIAEQFLNAGGGCDWQQETASRTLGRQTVSGLQQKRNADGKLGWLGSRQQSHPLPLGQRVLSTGVAGEIGHEITHHLATGAKSPGQLIAHRRGHGRDAVIPTGPSRHPFRVGDVAVAESRREQHRPELIAAQKHHHSLRWPAAEALGTQEQRPELTRRNDPLKLAPATGGIGLQSCGIGTRHQHQRKPQSRLRSARPQQELAVERFRQRTHPGAQFTRTIGDKNNRERWIRGSERHACRIML